MRPPAASTGKVIWEGWDWRLVVEVISGIGVSAVVCWIAATAA